MFKDFIKVNVRSLSYKLGNVSSNEIVNYINENNDAHLILFNELSLTSSSLFNLKDHLDYLDYVNDNLKYILEVSKNSNSVLVLGLPLAYLNNIYNAMIVVYKGEILGGRTKGNEEFITNLLDKEVLISSKNLYTCNKYSFEIIFRNDLYQNYLYKDSNLVLVVDDKETTIDDDIDLILKANAARLHKCFVYCGASNDESSANGAYLDHKYIIDHLNNEESSNTKDLSATININSLKFNNEFKGSEANVIFFRQESSVSSVNVKKNPFLVKDYYKVIELQKSGLKKRLNAIHSHDVVLGFSGGLDSTLALIVLKELSKEMELIIHCLILPCFASSNKTMNNAINLCEELDVDFKIIDLSRSVESHLLDLGHPLDKYDVTFENAQARERTQVLFDVANSCNGIVVGTGDLSEIALGFSTFNGDHISNYNVNGGICKTLIRQVVLEYSREYNLKTLIDILNTPISPELIPSKDKKIVQETEQIVGPYELIDFIIYYYFVCGNSMHDIYLMCKESFKEIKDLKHYFKNFFIRFFRNQFKRNCYSDGLKVFNLSFNPRGDFNLASDLEIKDYLDLIDKEEE